MVESRFVWLTAGTVIPLAAFELALDLERRGVRLTLDGEDVLVEGRDVHDDDLAGLRRWKRHIRALLARVADDTHLRGNTTIVHDTRRTA